MLTESACGNKTNMSSRLDWKCFKHIGFSVVAHGTFRSSRQVDCSREEGRPVSKGTGDYRGEGNPWVKSFGNVPPKLPFPRGSVHSVLGRQRDTATEDFASTFPKLLNQGFPLHVPLHVINPLGTFFSFYLILISPCERRSRDVLFLVYKRSHPHCYSVV